MDKSQLAKQIGRKITEAREEAGLTRADVGEQLGLSERGYGHIEAGRALITLDHLLQLPRILGKPVSYFLPTLYVTPEELNDLSHDPLFGQLIEDYKRLDDEGRKVLLQLTERMVAKVERRK